MQHTWERWEFFHPSLSPFGYNESIAQDYYPLDQQQAQIYWYHRSSYSSDPVIPAWAQTIERKNYTNEQRASLGQDPEIINKILVCEVSWRPYKIQKAELEFYRTHHLPLPSNHSDIRHEERMKLKPNKELFLRNCHNCYQEIISVYPQDYDGKVYCESCYQKEVFG
jgi:hypothetical protein